MTENGITCYDKIKKISSLKPGLMDQVIQRFDKSNVAERGTLEDYPCETGQHKVITGASLVGGGNTLILHGVVSGMDALYAGIPKMILPAKFATVPNLLPMASRPPVASVMSSMSCVIRGGNDRCPVAVVIPC